MSWSECCENSVVEEGGHFYCDYCGQELNEDGGVKDNK